MNLVSTPNTIIFIKPLNFAFPPSFLGSLGSGSADGACHADDIDCYNVQDRLGMEAIRTLHQQLDDDDNGNIDLSESDDVSLCCLVFSCECHL